MKKRVISVVMILVLCVFSNPWTADAAVADYSLEYEMARLEYVDSIMREMNELVAVDIIERNDDRMRFSDNTTYGLKKNEGMIESQDALLREKKQEYENKLESVGVNKIDPNDPQDMKLLEDMQRDMYEKNSTVYSMARANVYDIAPDFAVLANVYTLYLMDGKYRHNGVWYNYRYIQVTDDKGYNGLTYSQDNDLTANIKQSAVQSVLKYNFGYLTDKLSGVLSLGTAPIEWILGNIFAGLDGVNAAKITRSRKNNLYEVTHVSVTQMRYCFFYNDGWQHIGTSGSASVARRDSFVGNVNAQADIKDEITKFHIQSKWGLLDFVSTYAEVMDTRPDFCVIDDFGKLTIKGFNNQKFYFKPVFASEPIELI